MIVRWFFSRWWFVGWEIGDRWERREEGKQGRLPGWLFWFFPASMLLWVNLHGGWLFGIALLGIYTLAAFVESIRAQKNIAFAAIRAAHSLFFFALILSTNAARE